ncbi:hypothetical protein [Streptomyces sp. S186]|uniref:hypothetical protein n=1 Tax=Streptomyces sp. S186 TaxID=3434395 RepID=UPI003F66E61A
MLTTHPLPAAAGSGPGLLAALGAWTWLGVDPADTDLAHLPLAHPPGRTEHDTAAAIEARMRHLSASLGGLAEPQDQVPDLGECLLIVDTTTVLLRFNGSRFGTRLPVRPGWTRHVRDHGQAVMSGSPFPAATSPREAWTCSAPGQRADRSGYTATGDMPPRHHRRRIHALPALYKAAAESLPTLADKGYIGAGIGIRVPVRRPKGQSEQALHVDTRTANGLIRCVRSLGE